MKPLHKNSLHAVIIIFLLNFLSDCHLGFKEKVIDIPKGKIGLIGYGSLTSKKSMENTLGKTYEGQFRIIHLNGFRRHWNYICPNDKLHAPLNEINNCVFEGDTIVPQSMIFLNIERVEDKSMNCCFFIINDSDLIKFDQREKGYQRIEVKNSIEEFTVISGNVYAFKALPSYTKEPEINNPYKNAISGYYLNILKEAFSNLGKEYENEFYESTVKYHESLVLDCYLVR